MVTHSKPVAASGIPRDLDADIAQPLVIALGAITARAVRDARQHGIRL
jgi:hypothetical protein